MVRVSAVAHWAASADNPARSQRRMSVIDLARKKIDPEGRRTPSSDQGGLRPLAGKLGRLPAKALVARDPHLRGTAVVPGPAVGCVPAGTAAQDVVADGSVELVVARSSR